MVEKIFRSLNDAEKVLGRLTLLDRAVGYDGALVHMLVE